VLIHQLSSLQRRIMATMWGALRSRPGLFQAWLRHSRGWIALKRASSSRVIWRATSSGGMSTTLNVGGRGDPRVRPRGAIPPAVIKPPPALDTEVPGMDNCSGGGTPGGADADADGDASGGVWVDDGNDAGGVPVGTAAAAAWAGSAGGRAGGAGGIKRGGGHSRLTSYLSSRPCNCGRQVGRGVDSRGGKGRAGRWRFAGLV